MAIVQPIREDTFIAMMHGRSFSDRGLRCLFRHLETVSEEMGTDVMFDVEELCAGYTELSLSEALEDYGDLDGYPTHSNMDDVLEWFAEHACVYRVNASRILFRNL